MINSIEKNLAIHIFICSIDFIPLFKKAASRIAYIYFFKVYVEG